MAEQQGITALKDLLFREENEKYLQLNEQMKLSYAQIEEKLANRELPDAEFNEIIERMVKVMPEKLGPTITATLKSQIKESKDEVVQALFPIIGQMIKKYIGQEIAVLSEKIDQQLETVFSFDHLVLRIKAMATGAKYSELLLQKTQEPQIQEIFIIEEDSGILLASYSRSKSLDQDMIAGMLTAIKSFVEDAFESADQQLETIAYDAFTIYIQNFGKFNIAVALTGILNATYKSQLNDIILKFVKEVAMKSSDLEKEKMEKKMSKYFEKL